MNNHDTSTLINPVNGNLAFKIFSFKGNGFFDHIQRTNYYSLIWIKQGVGKLKADFSEYNFSDNNLLAFSPYQPFMLTPENNLTGIAIQFHPDFFCIHKHQQEVACNGVLFNNIYYPPIVVIDHKAINIFKMLIDEMKSEMQNTALAQHEILVSYLKIFLITASREKVEQQSDAESAVADVKEPFILQSLKEAIEANYKEKHTASEYAKLLNISTKALAKVAKTHLNKTLTFLISERIIIEAKKRIISYKQAS